MRRMVILGALLPIMMAAAQAQEYRFATDSSAPIDIRAAQLIVHYEDNYAEYQGDVRAVQGPLQMTAERLRIHFAEDGGAFSHWRAEGNIVLVSEGKTATGQWLHYDVAEDEMRMGDKVRLKDDRLRLAGALFVLDVASGRARLQASQDGGRARARFLVPQESR